jgi:NhaA family Na+:H+ antiporter
MPLFALANAGVTVAGLDLSGDAGWVVVGIVVARVAGKAIGIAGAAWLARATNFAVWSPGQTGRGIALVGLVGGIGFTVPLFVAHLVFPPGALRVAATLGLLVGSAASGVIGLVYGMIALSRPHAPAASTES